MTIKVLGPGCPKCKQLYETVLKVAEEKGLSVDVEKVTEIKDIMSYGVMSTPALVVDGEVKCSGRAPKAKEIGTWLT